VDFVPAGFFFVNISESTQGETLVLTAFSGPPPPPLPPSWTKLGIETGKFSSVGLTATKRYLVNL